MSIGGQGQYQQQGYQEKYYVLHRECKTLRFTPWISDLQIKSIVCSSSQA
ncbi:hypothetical protein Lepto7376_1955 [[Leptolyngbya] sp. PCC 7376]|nr:hypothetical protein Lepto7376_1955 [[Leptolyngbya] sp. PCC 7376]